MNGWEGDPDLEAALIAWVLDPYGNAGAWMCRGCGAVAYATDASWLTADRILASFSQPHRGGCKGPRSWSAVIDADALVDGEGRMRPAPRGNSGRARRYYREHSCRACGALTSSRYCDRCRCQEMTRQHERCSNKAGTAGTCHVHGVRAAKTGHPGPVADEDGGPA